MVKITQGQLKKTELRLAVRAIYNSTKFGPKRARQIAKMGKKLDVEFVATDEQYDKILPDFAVLGENGKPQQLAGHPPGTFDIAAEKHDEFTAKIDGLDAVEVGIDGVAFTMDDLEVVGNLSPAQISALEPFLPE